MEQTRPKRAGKKGSARSKGISERVRKNLRESKAAKMIKKVLLVVIMGLCLSGAGDSQDLLLAKGQPPSAGYLPNPPYVTYQEGVSLKEYVNYRFNALEKQTAELSGLMAERMKDFPSQFAKTGELSELRSKIEILMSGSDQLKGRFVTQEQFESARNDIIELKKARDIATGMATQTQMFITLGIALIGAVLAFVGLVRGNAKDR